jgi:osmoprotectant transport system permease protein
VTGAALIAQAGDGFVRDPDSEETSCAADNGAFCVQWAIDNFDRYVDPTFEHIFLTVVSVGIGFVVAFALAVLSHRQRWLIPPITGATGVLYTIPSFAFFFLLLPFTGRGNTTAIIALSAYTLQIIYRNIVTGLTNVPEAAKDSGRGMGMTDRQLLWRVELPLATPELIAGLRIATVSTVALATLAVFAGAGGLGDPIYAQLTFKTNIIVAGGLCILIALAFDLMLVTVQKLTVPWRTVRPV